MTLATSLILLGALMAFDCGITAWALTKADPKYGFYERNPWEKLCIAAVGTVPGLALAHAVPLAVVVFAGWHWSAYAARVMHFSWLACGFYAALAVQNIMVVRKGGAG